MSISSQLLILNQTKENIKTSINNKGVSVTDEPFAEYPDKIRLIPNGGGWYESNVILWLEKKIRQVEIPNGVTSIGAYAFDYCTKLESVTIPNTVTSIGDLAFEQCTSLDNVNIPSSVTSIGLYAFNRCNALNNLVIPSGVTITEYAFSWCTSLTSVNIPSGATVGNAAFINCTSLASVNIDSGAISIGSGAFQDCESLTSVTVNSTTPPTLGSDAFFNTSRNLRIYVPDESVLAYQTADGWMDYASKIKGISEKPQ